MLAFNDYCHVYAALHGDPGYVPTLSIKTAEL